jgi:DNA-binding Lrp family transcriptional regulator
MTAVWEHSQQTLGTRLVVLALADYAHDDGTNAFPSVSTLAKKAHMSERNVQYALRKLEQAGEIARDGVHLSGAVIWRITLPGMGAKSAPAKSARGAKNDVGGVQKTTSRGAKVAPKPSVTVSNEPSVVPPVVPQTKNHRCPVDWMPSEGSRAYAIEWGIPAEYVDEVVAEFREYWSGQRRARPGWDLSFKTHVRKVAWQYKNRARASPNGAARGANAFQAAIATARKRDAEDEQRRNGQGAHAHKYALLAGSEGREQGRDADGGDVDPSARGHPLEAVYRERP